MNSRQKVIGYLSLLPVWGAAPFLNDRSSALLVVLYVAYLLVAVGYSLWVGFRFKSSLLVALSLVTAFAWPIVLFLVLYFFGM